MADKNSYGLAAKKQGKQVSWLLLIVLILWLTAMGMLGGSRMAKLIFGEGGFYAPWQFLAWEGQTTQQAIKDIALQTQALMVAPILLVLLIMAKTKLKGRSDLHGSARWAQLAEIEKMSLLVNDGVYVGGFWEPKKKIHYYLRHNGPEHILCFAPTRSGKGVGLILPTLYGWTASSIVLDIKGENWALTSGYLKGEGHKVVRFDPSDASGLSASFNPLEEVRLDSVQAIPDVQNIAAMVMDPQGKGLEDYWNKAAFGFFGGAMLHAIIITKKNKGRAASLYDVSCMLEDPDREIKEVFQEMLDTDHAAILKEMNPNLPDNVCEAARIFVAAAARGMLQKADNEMAGVVSSATANLSLYRDPIVASNISRCDFKINDLMNSENPVNLYLVLSPADIDRIRPLIRIIVSLILGRLTEKMEFADGSSVAAYKHRLLLMLDEFSSLGKLPIVERAIAYMAGYGVKGYFIVQDITQLNSAYGKDNALMGNCHIRIAYAPNTIETAKILSDMSGKTTVVDIKKSISGVGGKSGKSISRNVSETARPLLTPDECMRLPAPEKDALGKVKKPGDMLIFVAGQPPIYGRQILYFLDPVFSKRSKVAAPKQSDILQNAAPVKAEKSKELFEPETKKEDNAKSYESFLESEN